MAELLIDRILDGELGRRRVSPEEHLERKRLAEIMRTTTVIVADGATEASGKAKWDVDDDFPNIAPPLEHFWIETVRPSVYDRHFIGGPGDASYDRWGALIESRVVDGRPRPRRPVRRRVADVLARRPQVVQPKWVLSLSLAVSMKIPRNRATFWPAMRMEVPVAADGRSLWGGAADGRYPELDLVAADWMEREVKASDFGLEHLGAALAHMCATLLFGVCFMHCRNVERRLVEPSVWEKQLQRKKKRPRVRYHVLEVEAMRKVLRTEGREDEVGIKKALHICRGHFAHYTKEAPLFGKTTGTFWRPQHVRGSKDQGVVVKDYKIRSGGA